MVLWYITCYYGYRIVLWYYVYRMVLWDPCLILFSSFPLLLAFDVGGLGFEFCVFVASWRHALRNEWPIIIITTMVPVYRMVLRYYWPGVVLRMNPIV